VQTVRFAQRQDFTDYLDFLNRYDAGQINPAVLNQAPGRSRFGGRLAGLGEFDELTGQPIDTMAGLGAADTGKISPAAWAEIEKILVPWLNMPQGFREDKNLIEGIHRQIRGILSRYQAAADAALRANQAPTDAVPAPRGFAIRRTNKRPNPQRAASLIVRSRLPGGTVAGLAQIDGLGDLGSWLSKAVKSVTKVVQSVPGVLQTVGIPNPFATQPAAQPAPLMITSPTPPPTSPAPAPAANPMAEYAVPLMIGAVLLVALRK